MARRSTVQRATYSGTRKGIMKEGVIGLNKDINGFVNFTKTLIKKNPESSL